MRQRRDPPRPTMPRQSKGGAVRYRPQRIRLYTIRPAPGTPAPDTPAHQLTPVPIARRRLGSYLQFRFTTPPVPHSPEAPAPHSPVPFTQIAAFCTGRSPCTPTLLIARNARSGGNDAPLHATPTLRPPCGPLARPLHGQCRLRHQAPGTLDSGPTPTRTARTLRPLQTVDAPPTGPRSSPPYTQALPDGGHPLRPAPYTGGAPGRLFRGPAAQQPVLSQSEDQN